MGTTVFRRVSVAAGIVVAMVGSLVLLGWLTDSSQLKAVLPNSVTMKANTALCLLLLGLALSLSQVGHENWSRSSFSVRLLSSLVVAVGLITLLEYLISADLGIDQWLFSEPPGTVRTSQPGRMAPTTAVSFILLGSAILFSRSRRGLIFAQISSMTALTLPLLSLVGYVFAVEWFKGVGAYTAMAIHTAGSFAILTVGILCAYPDRGIMAAIRSRSAGGVLLRRLLPAAVLVPLLIGWLRLEGETQGLYGTRLGVALYAVSVIAILVVLVVSSAVSLDRLDKKRLAAEGDLGRFFTLSLDLFCVAGVDGYFKRLNPAWTKVLGFTADELTARPYADFVHPADRAATASEARKLADGVDVTFRNRYLRKNGSYVWLEWICKAPDGQSDLICGVARDITERMTFEEKLQKLNAELEMSVRETEAVNKELEAFSYSVSHDLRAPLRAVDGFSKILLEDQITRLDDEGRRILNVIRENTEHMGRLIDDLLEFSRTGRKPLQFTPIDMNALVKSEVEQVRAADADRDLQIKVGELPPAHGDQVLLRSVWSNLLSNAVKYTRPRDTARIEVSAELKNGEIIYSIRDNGVGFDMKYAHKLYEVFQRLHGNTEFEGTGVGLALVRRIVHRHGGRTWAEGLPDHGASFHFSLPRDMDQ